MQSMCGQPKQSSYKPRGLLCSARARSNPCFVLIGHCSRHQGGNGSQRHPSRFSRMNKAVRGGKSAALEAQDGEIKEMMEVGRWQSALLQTDSYPAETRRARVACHVRL